MFEISNLSASRSGTPVLHDVNLRLEKGETRAVLGRNGVGKTTLLDGLVGRGVRVRGSIRLDGTDVTGLPTHLAARAGIALVPQGREMISGFSVHQTVTMGSYARPEGFRDEIPEFILDIFPIINEHLNRDASMLSGGQQQQVAIARALAAEPKILLLDEPTEGIQPNVIEDIAEAITRLREELGLTVLLVEQNVGFARSLASTFTIIDSGESVVEGSIDELTAELMQKHIAF